MWLSLARAPALGAGGRRFESCHPDCIQNSEWTPSIIYLICRCGSMVEHQPSKLNTWVRFPSPALFYAKNPQAMLEDFIIDMRVFLRGVYENRSFIGHTQ